MIYSNKSWGYIQLFNIPLVKYKYFIKNSNIWLHVSYLLENIFARITKGWGVAWNQDWTTDTEIQYM